MNKLSIGALILVSAMPLTAQPVNQVILQGFHWESHQHKWWNIIEQKSEEIKQAGFDMVWLPPSQGAASDEGYIPHRYYYQNSLYGNEFELKNAIKSLHNKGIKVLADIVINHRVGSSNWSDFTEPSWGVDAICKDDEWQGAKGNSDSGVSFNAGRDIDHSKKYVQDSIAEWLNWLKTSIGYDGWRYDYAMGFDASYVNLYNQRSNPYFSVAEVWPKFNISNPDLSRQDICNWLDRASGNTTAFDFTTKGILQHSLKNHEYWRLRDWQGKPAGLIGWWPSRSVTFIDNHDTGPSTGGDGGQNQWAFPSELVTLGYVYILTHPGYPSIYWVHYFDWNLQDFLKKLIHFRKLVGIHAESVVEIQVADSSKYAAIIDQKIAVKIGYGDWSPPEKNWRVVFSGHHYAIWQKK